MTTAVARLISSIPIRHVNIIDGPEKDAVSLVAMAEMVIPHPT